MKRKGRESRGLEGTSAITRAPLASARKENIRKLAPPRPFPTVATSVSASGPKSAHKEGKNLICITRHTPLAAYLSRCKKLLVEDGYQFLHLHAMGAAIPHLLTLTISLPPILPFSRDNIHLKVQTGTIEVMDEVIPEDEDEDISLRARGKGGVSVLLEIRDEGSLVASGAHYPCPAQGSSRKVKKGQILVVNEQDQEDEVMNHDPDKERDLSPSWYVHLCVILTHPTIKSYSCVCMSADSCS